MLYLVQRIHKEAGKDGDDIRENLIQGCATADSALAQIQDYFDDDTEWKMSYNNVNKRFSIIPVGRDLLYNIVKKSDEHLIDEVPSNAGNTDQE